jgi:hypothetical protein
LQEEATAAQRLAQLNQEQADAVARLVRAEVVSGERNAFRKGLIANVLFFVAGVAATIAVTVFTH